jgi:serine/threonine protein kinase
MLGEGAWGKVFTLTDPDAGVFVLKCIAKSQHTSLRSIKCLKNEISVMQRLSSKSLVHPNIVRLYNVYSSSSHVFLQLEHGGTETLAMRLKRRDAGAADASMSLRDALSLASQCADALNHLHNKAKVAHRDLKTENIIFSETESGYQIKVVDFGLASVCGSETMCYSRCGTFVFLAPEVILGDGYNACIADVWSMGIIFLEILCFLHFPDTVLFRRRRHLSEEQAMEQVCARLGTSESMQELFQTYLRPEYRVKGISKSTTLCGMLNVVPSDRSRASDVSLCCAALLLQSN